MRKFIVRVLLFVLPVIVLIITGELLLRRLPNDYRNKRNYLDKYASDISILILGSSHALNGINPDYFSEKAFNAAYISQTIDLDAEIIKKYDMQWQKLKYIVLSLSYFTLEEQIEKSIEAWRIKNYVLYWKTRKSCKITDHSEILGNKLRYNLYRIGKYYFFGENPVICDENGWKKKYENKSTATGKERAKLHTIDDPISFKENTATVESIIQYATSKNLKIILLTFPASQSYIENLDFFQINKVIDFATAMTEKYANTFHYNFLTDSTFLAGDFFDADHLNEKGSAKLSIKLNEIFNAHKIE